MTLPYENVLVLPMPSADGRQARSADAPTPDAIDHVDSPASANGITPSSHVTQTIAVCSLILFAALAGPALCGLVYTADDLGAFHLPLRAFYLHAIENGDGFDWCGELFGGFYLTGEGQAGTYHPLHWLVYRLLPLAWAWNIECLASYPLLSAGVWLWLRGRKLAAAEALFGATAFTFCSFNLLHFVHVNAMAVVAHVPWLLYAIDRLSEKRACTPGADQTTSAVTARGRQRLRGDGSVTAAMLIAALTASQLLLGYPQYVLYSLAAEAVYILFGFERCEDAAEKRSNWQTAASWALAKLLAIAVAAVQVLPTFEAFADSVRQGASASFTSQGSLHGLNALQLLVPYLFTTRVVGENTHELGLYIGAVPLLLSVVAVSGRISDRVGPMRLRRFAVALVAVGGLVALGEHGPVQRLLGGVPVFGWFRFPCRAQVLLQLGLALLAAIGFGIIVRGSNQQQIVRLPLKGLTLVLLGSVALAVVGPLLWPQFTAAALLVWAGPLLIGLSILLLINATHGRRWALHALVILTAIDLGTYGLSYAPYRGLASLEEYIGQVSTPASAKRGRVALDLAMPNCEGLRAGNQILLRGWSRIDGYAGLQPARQLDYRRPAALRVAGVTAVARSAPVNQVADSRGAQLSPLSDEWLEAADALPRVRLVASAFATDDPADDIERIDSAHSALIAVSDRSLVERHLDSPATPAPKSGDISDVGSAELIAERPGQIVIESNATRPAILILNESFHRGWKATAGESPLTAIRVNGDFLGCLVPAGKVKVEFSFAPASLFYGRLLSVCGLGFLLILLATSRRSHFCCSEGA